MLERIIEKTNVKDTPIIILTVLAIVSFWRGVWGLMDLYLFPKSPTLSFFVSIIIGLVILFIIAFYQPKKDRK